jgi:hypothetical protein
VHVARPRVVVTLLSCAAALVFIASASADVACGNAGGTICCSNQTWLPLRNVAVSYWYGTPGLSYYARRQDDSGSLTYNHSQSTGGNWSFDNGVDVVRGTGIWRGPSAPMDFAISQASHTSC